MDKLKPCPEISEHDKEVIERALEEVEHLQKVAKSVCPHLWRAGNRILANGEVDRFMCRRYLEKYGHKDEMLIIKPYTDEELIQALKQHCAYYHGETCDTARKFYFADRRADPIGLK